MWFGQVTEKNKRQLFCSKNISATSAGIGGHKLIKQRWNAGCSFYGTLCDFKAADSTFKHADTVRLLCTVP